jgi:hypothetical protein
MGVLKPRRPTEASLSGRTIVNDEVKLEAEVTQGQHCQQHGERSAA